GQAGQDHGVESAAEMTQHHHGADDRQRDGRQADDGGAPLEEEGDDDEGDEDAADQHGDAQVGQGQFDEAGRAEDARADLDVGQARPQYLDGFLDVVRHFEGVGPGILFDDDKQADLIVDD